MICAGGKARCCFVTVNSVDEDCNCCAAAKGCWKHVKLLIIAGRCTAFCGVSRQQVKQLLQRHGPRHCAVCRKIAEA